MGISRKERMVALFSYLRYKGLVKTQKDLANKLGASYSNISSAMKGEERACTDNLLKRINRAYEGIFREDWLLNGEGEMLAEDKQPTIGSQTQMGIYNNITNGHAGAASSPTLPQAGANTEMPMPNQTNDAVLLDVISRQTDVISSLTRELASVRMQLEQQSAKMREMESALGCLAAHARTAHSEGTAQKTQNREEMNRRVWVDPH